MKAGNTYYPISSKQMSEAHASTHLLELAVLGIEHPDQRTLTTPLLTRNFERKSERNAGHISRLNLGERMSVLECSNQTLVAQRRTCANVAPRPVSNHKLNHMLRRDDLECMSEINA